LDKVGDGLGGILFKQAANDSALAGFQHGIGSGCASHSLLEMLLRISESSNLAEETGQAPSLLHRLLYADLWFGCIFCCGCGGALDFDVVDFDRENRPLAISGGARNFLNQFDRGIVALAENGVLAIETGVWDLSDEELRAVGVGSGVGIGETSGAIEGDIR